MKNEDPAVMVQAISDNPVLVELCRIAESHIGMRFLVLFPHRDGWAQVVPGFKADSPGFCRLIQSSDQGGRRCRMCHVLMAVAASSREVMEQKCHAGVSVIVIPVDFDGGEAGAILSSCHFTSDWNEVAQRGSALGISLADLEKQYLDLKRPENGEIDLAKSIMSAAGKALVEIRRKRLVVDELERLRGVGSSRDEVIDSVKYELRSSLSRPGRKQEAAEKGKKSHALIDVVVDLVSARPAMPYSVFDISAAARMTPNHFSALFKKQAGVSFSDFLADKRLELSKSLLKDLTMNIAEISGRVGYDDPGYFARRFKQKMGMTPREWRHRLS